MNLATTKLPIKARTMEDHFPSFSKLSKFWLGDDNLFNSLLDWNMDTSYPRFNLVKMDDQGYRIEVGVPGWDKEDLHVSLDNGWLKISGEQTDEDRMETYESYVHKGLSTKSFERSFRISDNLKLERVYLEQGLLCLEMFFVKKEEPKATEIPIQEY